MNKEYTGKKQSISVIGLGKLGIPFALSFADAGFHVWGFDVNRTFTNLLKRKKSPISEPNTQHLLQKNHERIHIASTIKDTIAESNISFIVVPTPSLRSGEFSTHYIEEVIQSIGKFIRNKKEKHTVVITSTLSPQSMQIKLAPLLERVTGKTIGVDIGFCYSPELIALGTVVSNIRKPDFIFIGESDVESGRLVEQVRRGVCVNNPECIRTSWINAELIKLSLNAYITTKINFANMIARVSEVVPGANSDTILNAIGSDTRIGRKYLTGGLGFGGPCFPRDNLSLYATIRKSKLPIKLPLITHAFNKSQINYLYKIIEKAKKSTVYSVGILGFSYKPDTDVIDESQGMLLAKKLLDKGIVVLGYDPLAMKQVKITDNRIKLTKGIKQCIQNADVIVITTQSDVYKKIMWENFSPKTIVDCWRIINVGSLPKKHTLIQLGKYIPS